MRVKELIELLERYNPNADVIAVDSGKHYEFPRFFSSNGYNEKGATEVYFFLEHLNRKLESIHWSSDE